MKNNQFTSTANTSVSSAHSLPKSEFSSPKINRSVLQICKLPKSDAKVTLRHDVSGSPRSPCRRESATKSPDTAWLTIHNQFTTYGRNAKEWLRKCALLLPQIEKQQIWRKKRFHSIYDYAAKLVGMNRDQVNNALRIVGKAENLPALKEVISLKGLNAVRPIIAIATEANQAFLAEKAMSMSKNTLETFVRHFRKGEIVGVKFQPNLQIEGCPSTSAQSVNLQTLTPGRLEFRDVMELRSTNSLNLPFEQRSAEIQTPKITITMQLDPQLANQLEKIKGQGDWNETICELLKLRQEKLEQNKPEVVEVKTKLQTANESPIYTSRSIATKPGKNTSTKGSVTKIYTSRTIPTAIQKYVIAKTNGSCAFPGCTKPHKILHHTDRFAIYHIHDPDYIFPLCEAHERLAHLGLIENENQPPQFWKLRAWPNYDDPQYEVDRVVEKFRQPNRQ